MNSGDVGRIGRRALGGLGRLASDGEDGAFAGVVQRGVEPVGAGADARRATSPRVAVRPVAQRLAEAEEKMGQHHPGVAPGAQDGGARHGAPGLRKRRVAERPEGVGDGAEGQAEVGAGIAVGHREDVDPVDLVTAGGHPVGGGEDRARQPGTVDVRDPDGHARGVTPRRPRRVPPREPRDAAGRAPRGRPAT